MLPLTALKNPSNPHARLITRNVRTILEEGGGLPLLFPNFELGFGYGNATSEATEDWTQDSMGYTPRLRVGHLLPHVELEIIKYSKENYPNLQALEEKGATGVHITSSDLPAQLRNGDPCFVLLFLNGTDNESEIVSNALDAVKADCSTPITSVEVFAPNTPVASTLKFDLAVRDNKACLSELLPNDHDSALILVRPDGHVASMTTSIEDMQESHIKKIITAAIGQSL